jgi:hypothetical protein
MTFGQIVTVVHNRRRLRDVQNLCSLFEDTPQRQSWRSHNKVALPAQVCFRFPVRAGPLRRDGKTALFNDLKMADSLFYRQVREKGSLVF